MRLPISRRVAASVAEGAIRRWSGEAHGDLRDVLRHRIALRLHAEHRALLLLHAEQRVGLLDIAVGGVREERAQLPAAPETGGHIVRGGKERIQARVLVPCRSREQDGLQTVATDRAQVGDAVANTLLQLLLVTRTEADARLDRLDHELDRVGDQLTVRCVVRDGSPPPNRADATRSKSEDGAMDWSPESGTPPAVDRRAKPLLPAHRLLRHPRAQRPTLIQAPMNALGERFSCRHASSPSR